MGAEIVKIKKRDEYLVWVERTGFCPLTEKRMTEALKKFRIKVRVKKRPKVVMLTKGKVTLQFKTPEEAARFAYKKVKGLDARSVTRLFKSKAQE